jgi:hypothetical protein
MVQFLFCFSRRSSLLGGAAIDSGERYASRIVAFRCRDRDGVKSSSGD